MRIGFILVASSLYWAVACGGSDAKSGLSAGEAAETATSLSGGTASGSAVSTEEDGHELWEVHVTMANGADLEVLLFANSGELFEVKDTKGPFDYDQLDPLPGQLTYAEGRDVAFDAVDGEQIAWEVKYDDGHYFYEFYVRDANTQLWEIKLWADTGEVFVTEEKAAID